MNANTDRRALLGAMGFVAVATVAGVAATAAAPPVDPNWQRIVTTWRQSYAAMLAHAQGETWTTDPRYPAWSAREKELLAADRAAWRALIAYPAKSLGQLLEKFDILAEKFEGELEGDEFELLHADIRRLAK